MSATTTIEAATVEPQHAEITLTVNGETHRVKVYDRSAPTPLTRVVATPEMQRPRERPAPTR